MRILILHNFYQHLGGEDSVVQQEADALIKRGHEVKIINNKNKKGLVGLTQYILYPFNISIVHTLLKKIKEYNPEIIHIHNLHYAIGPLIIRKLKKKGYPIVMTLHNFRLICPSATLFYNNKIHTESIQQDFPWTAIKNKALDNSFVKTLITGFTYYIHKKIKTWNYVDRFIIMSEFNKSCFIKANIGLTNDNITIKPNFVDLPAAEINKDRDRFFLYVGRISSEKGIEQLVHHFSKFDETLRIIGDGPLFNILKEKTKNNLNIIWLGAKNKEEVHIELKQCSAIIIPSVCYEGAVPLTVLEGMATKTPIIASNIGPIPNVIENEISGWLFNPHSKESLLAAITSFKNSKTNNSIIDTAYSIFLTTFIKNIIIDKLTNIYQNAINQNEYHNSR